ncbi:FadR/GntR family transcriptional regulator [Vibrio sp. ER1A]|uniref:FadR/GntR family transcriptional regulator n=1 Tax=Vibrio sp. ER1A TaxID=1517681 RepID=UPI0004DCD509|nr:FCD domain-containing protein [Vibrio sp. ER1A]KFA99374.1 GntR family transcriptional regulator [Vibrio sp. ER1A]
MTVKKRRTENVASAIKKWIVEQKLQPGDRLPNEVEVMEMFDASKSTVREAMRLLDAQGLLQTKTGPKGGAFVSEVSEEKAQMLLSNYLFFKETSIEDLYQLRLALEPQLAASLAGKLTSNQLEELKDQTKLYAEPPRDIYEEREHHLASIEFHRILASFSSNELLKLVIRFTAQMLSDMTIYKKLYEPENYDLWRTGIDSQLSLIEALRVGDSEMAYKVMQKHMKTALKLMKLQEVEMENRFLDVI